jgi:NAD(P)H-hydrate epimerase
MKSFDSHTINEIGVPAAVLMERAALNVVAALKLPELGFDLARVVVVCGVGNNGGDGLAVARLLHLEGVKVMAVIIGDTAKMTAECSLQLRVCSAYSVPFAPVADLPELVTEATTIVDAMLGIGGNGELDGVWAAAATAINGSHAKVLAVDVPTGIIDGATPIACAVHADVTVTFAYPKSGLVREPGRQFAGEIYVADVGIYAP